jgi:hypothetical protein
MIILGTFRPEPTGWTLDWHHHGLERLPPAEDLAMNCFEKWAQQPMVTMIGDGYADVEEFPAGHSHLEPAQITPQTLRARAEPGEPKFAVGDTVLMHRSIASMHTFAGSRWRPFSVRVAAALPELHSLARQFHEREL